MDATFVNRRAFVAGAALTAASLAVPARAAPSRPEKRQVSIAVGGKAALYYLPLTVAERLGYFAAEGLDVQISDHPGSAQALQAVVAGAADVVSGAYEHTLKLQGRGQYFQAFVLQGRAPQITLGVSTRSLPHFKSLAELRGRRIGITGPGSSTSLMASLVLSRAGLQAGEVSLVGVGTSAGALAALRSGQIDAICNVDPVMTMLEHRGDVRVVVDTRTLKGSREIFGGLMPAACLYAPTAFIERYPGTAQALSSAIVHSLKWLQTAGPGDILKTVPEEYLMGDRGLYLASFEKIRESIAVDGLFPEEGSRTALRALASVDAAFGAGRIDLARTYTNQFASLAKARFKA